tara:strand:- start:3875 stop:5257 length:1383 start_codon:yes stop_codon:yes gene_type:complete
MEMLLTEKYKIRQLFTDMNSKKNFLELLNFSKKIIYGDKVIPFEKKQLGYYISKDSNKRKNNRKTYTTFYIDKKNGDKRIIHAPVKGLKEIQKTLNLILQAVHEPNENATGFVTNKSIVDNSSVHVGKNYVFNIDLKDFFPSVDASRVWGRLLIKPFNLGNSNERKKIANMIKTLCTTELEVERKVDGDWKKEKRFVLPQGAPTSPTITNAICDRLDRRLSGLSRRFNLNYTRYADDITFSSYHNSYKNKNGEKEPIYSAESSFRNELLRIITDQNFHIKESKIRLQKRGYRQEVTGLSVNNKVNVSRKYIKDLRQTLHFWEIHGMKNAEELLKRNPGGPMAWQLTDETKKCIISKRPKVENSVQPKIDKLLKWEKIKTPKNSPKTPSVEMVIEGKLLYLKMVKGPYDSTYLKLKSRFDNLLSRYQNNNKIKTRPLSELEREVDKIFDYGYENALKKYIN